MIDRNLFNFYIIC